VTGAETERTLALDGAVLRYLVEGSGAGVPMAFAHGWCSKLEHWAPQAEHLAGSRTVVRWDRRGMGRSTSAAPAESPRRHAEDLVAILDREGLDRVVIAGHAGGGPTAAAFAATYPERTLGLVMVDTRVHRPAPPGQQDRFAEGIDRSTRRLAGDDGRAHFERMYRAFFGPRADRAIVDDAVANALGTPLPIATAEMRHMVGDVAALAERVTCPVLWASAQPTDTAPVLATFPAAVPPPLVGHVVGSGHFVQLEVPEQLNPMIDVFLDTLDDLIDRGATA
jgi:pimeloyl-ACP methyl ester carboxylesterase